MFYFLLFIGLILLIPLGYSAFVLSQSFRLSRSRKYTQKIVICTKCLQQTPLQWFLCDSCRQVNDLTPTEKYPRYKPCDRCGKKLPTTNETGRRNLVAVCSTPGCGNIIGKKAGMKNELVVPLVGGPSSGKTAFLSAWVITIQQILADKYNVSFPLPSNFNYVANCLEQWANGVKPDKTAITSPPAFCMDVMSKETKKSSRLFLFDPAGEYFDRTQNLAGFHYYDYMDGVLFLIDPFSIPSVYEKYKKELRRSAALGFQTADRDVNDCCDRFLNSLKDYHHLQYDQYHFASCAIVLTKVDAFDLDTILGETAIRQKIMFTKSLSYMDAMDQLCRKFLTETGQGDVLLKLTEHFKEVRCFSVSSFGHMPDVDRRYVPQRVECPFLWILENSQTPRRSLWSRLSSRDE